MQHDTKKFLALSVAGFAALLGIEYAVYQSWKTDVSRKRQPVSAPSLEVCTTLIESHPKFSKVMTSTGTLSDSITGGRRYLWPPGTIKLKPPADSLNMHTVECSQITMRVAIRELADNE
jgi:hypothetical protein